MTVSKGNKSSGAKPYPNFDLSDPNNGSYRISLSKKLLTLVHENELLYVFNKKIFFRFIAKL